MIGARKLENKIQKTLETNIKNSHQFKTGELVYHKVMIRKNKLNPLWRGPYKLTSISKSNNVISISGSNTALKVNSSQLRPLK